MSAVTIQQMADRIAALMDQRFGTRGETLADRLRRGGRRLPRKVRAEAVLLAEAATRAGHPKLMAQNDDDRVARAFETCRRHLQDIGRTEPANKAAMGVASAIAFRLFVVGALVVAVLWWRRLV